ncbi:unnamed protein product [Larinioides sclopetarius]|uniref:Methyltransferase type 11 domain-containing protein n=1 Tax=Larinioides sclopetarius TaxID=280406 RepID=A0AAV1Z6X8_9ARAC
MSEESKKFGAQYDANVYSSYRKDTPVELIEKIIAFLKEKPLDTAVDVGCGNGQSTVILAPYFKRVHGSDVSEAQIEQAKATRSLPNVTYAASPAEKLPFEDGTVQLLTAATALHWFDLDTFLPEARRVLCANGVMAVYGYLNMKPLLDDPAKAVEVDELYIEYEKALESYHVMSRVSLLQNRYKDVKFPFEEVNRCPDFRCCFEGKLPDIVNYVSTWSGFQNFKKVDSKGAEELLDYFKKSASPAEKLPFQDGTVQLLTAATALHWFDLDTFLPEARRVLCANGVMAVYGYLNMKPLLDDPEKAAEVDELYIEYEKALESYHVKSRVSLLQNKYKDVEFPFEEVNRCPDVQCCFEGKLPDIVNYVSTWSGFQNFKKVDSKGAEELLEYFKKRLYEIGAACNMSSEDSTTLYRNFQLILCRKTKDGPFV